MVGHLVRLLILLTMTSLRTGDTQTPLCAIFNAEWSPDGAHIVFAAQCDGLSQIYLIDANGSNLRQLTTGQEGNTCPTWSPNAMQIAYLGFNGQMLKVLELDTAQTRTLARTDWTMYCPDWSPDGASIGVIEDAGDYEGGPFYLISPVDGAQTQLLATDQLVRDFDWSPDGTQIALTVGIDDSRGGDIYVIGANGSGLMNLSNQRTQPGYDACPTWSPDGKRIAFSSGTEFSMSWYPAVMNADGSGRRLLTTDWSGMFLVCPLWSPDGQQLAFTVVTGMLTQARRINLDGTGDDFFSSAMQPDTGRYYALGWSPDGESVLYVEDIIEERLYVAPDAGGDARQLFPPS